MEEFLLEIWLHYLSFGVTPTAAYDMIKILNELGIR